MADPTGEPRYSGGEAIPALVDLGVFTRDYRIVRAKYAKSRQIIGCDRKAD